MRFAGYVLILFAPAIALAGNIPLPAEEPVPGGVAVLKLREHSKTMPKVEMDGHRIMVVNQDNRWYAIVGIPLDTVPGLKKLEVQSGSAASRTIKFRVLPKTYGVQALTIKNPEMVNPTPEQLQRIADEQEHLDRIVNYWQGDSGPNLSFIWPAQGPETSHFGLKRVLNGEAKSPHSGVDIGGPTGTALMAPADAIVADIGDYYYCGTTLTLDMGQGLYSIYCHLSEIDVHAGQHVAQGQLVARIGATGRTTGPNLHWTVRLNGAAVDPHVFLDANDQAPKAATTAIPATATVPAPASATQSRH